MSKYKKCKLINKIIHAKPGQLITCYGRQWTIQPNGDAIADIHVDFHEVEVAAGRYIVLEDTPKKEPPELAKKFEKELTTDINEYYGMKSPHKLRSKLGTLKKDDLVEFAQKQFNVTFPPAMSKPSMIIEIMDTVISKRQENI